MLPTLSIGIYVAKLVDWLNINFSAPFELISEIMEASVLYVEKVLLYPPAFLMIAIVGLIAWRTAGMGMGLFSIFGLFFCSLMNLWEETMLTIALVTVATSAALLIGIPCGILSAVSEVVNHITRPLMDFMQTMPPWVYLIPAVILFSLGRTPATFATAVFAIPPALRLTNLGIRRVSVEYVEAGKAFGATSGQILMKVQIPSALPTIMAGVNQCIMLALSMVVLAGLIGAGGLGGEVVRGLTRMMLGVGVRAGLGIVILAIILDRISLGVVERFQKGPHKKRFW